MMTSIGARIAALMLTGTLPAPSDQPPELSRTEAIMKAGKCLGWLPKVIELLPTAMVLHSNMGESPSMVTKATVLQPTAKSCGFEQENATIPISQARMPMAMVILSDGKPGGVEILYLMVDLGSGVGNNHRYMTSVRIYQPGVDDAS